MTKKTIETPIGRMCLLEANRQLWVACVKDHASTYSHLFSEASDGPSPVLEQAEKELDEYFEGRRFAFSVPLGIQEEKWKMGSPFENHAWQTLTRIGYGRTISYKEQALWMGHPKAIRAVGRANGKNPLLIFIPCHRVIGSNGTLTGFGAGLKAKDFLLRLETLSVDMPTLRSREHHFAVLK